MTAGLEMPASLGVDTSLDTENANLDAPSFEMQLPIPTMDSFKRAMDMGATTPNGFTSTLTGEADGDLRSQVVSYGKKFLGMPYKWGGANPSTSFDCSGLVQYVAGKFGLRLPRVSYQQARAGQRTDIGSLRPGDLVAWDNSSRNNGADHIAFYIGNGLILESPGTGKQIRVRKIGKNEGAWGVALKYPGER